MNNNDETELERLMKASMAEKQFTLKPEYWEAAQDLIRQDRARKRRKAVLFWLPGSLFVGFTLSFLWIHYHQPLPEKGNLQPHQAIFAGRLAEGTARGPITTKTTEVPNLSEAPLPKQNQEQKPYTNEPKAISKSPETAEPATHRPALTREKTQSTLASTIAKKTVAEQGKLPANTENTTGPVNPATGVSNAEKSPVLAINPEVTSSPKVEKSQEPLIEKSAETPGRAHQAGLSDSLPQAETPLRPVPDSTRANSTQTDSTLASTAQRSPSRKKHWMISAGLSLYNPPVKLGSQPFNALLQGSYFTTLRQNYSFFAGLAYLQVNQHFAPRNYRSVNYLFGESTTETSINTYRSDYIFLPLGIDRLFAEKHHLLGGIAGAYLLNSYEELTEKRTENGQSQTRTYRSSGYKAGLQTYDIQIFAGYALQKASLRFSLAYYFGLTDTGRNAILRSNRVERNKGVQVSIGYLF